MYFKIDKNPHNIINKIWHPVLILKAISKENPSKLILMQQLNLNMKFNFNSGGRYLRPG